MEFADRLVNTETDRDQSAPSLTSLSDSGWVVTWTSDGQDSSGGGVYAQAYAANGVTQGSEFRVNTTTTGTQSEASVAGLKNGGWVVTWQSAGQDNDGSTGVYSRVYNVAGIPQQGVEFRVNTEMRKKQYEPSVADLNGDGWVVAWASAGQDATDEDGDGVYAQVYAANGDTPGSEFLVNITTAGTQSQASVTGLTGGGWVVAWRGNDGMGNAGIYARLYNDNGIAQDMEIQTSSLGITSTTLPAVTSLSGGGWVVTWQGLSGSESVPGNDLGLGIYGQAYTAAGIPMGNEFLVNTRAAGNQERPSVTGLTDGGWVVTWGSTGQDSDGSTGVYSRVYNAAGIPQQSVEFRVNTTEPGTQDKPTIAALNDGGWVVAWQSDSGQDGNGLGVYSKAYNADGTERAYAVVYSIGAAVSNTDYAVGLFADISLTDSDSATLASATITLADAVAGDMLELETDTMLTGGIISNYNSATGILTLMTALGSVRASPADYEAALENVVYSRSSTAGDLDADVDRTVTAVVNDGVNNSETIEIIIDYIL